MTASLPSRLISDLILVVVIIGKKLADIEFNSESIPLAVCTTLCGGASLVRFRSGTIDHSPFFIDDSGNASPENADPVHNG